MRRRVGAIVAAALPLAALLGVGAQTAHADPWICQSQPNPTITVSDGAANESAGSVKVKVTLNSCSSAKVKWATIDGTAKAGSDYTGGSGIMTLTPPHNDVLNLVFLLKKDLNCEGTENFHVWLSNATGATITDGWGVVTINDCHPVP